MRIPRWAPSQHSRGRAAQPEGALAAGKSEVQTPGPHNCQELTLTGPQARGGPDAVLSSRPPADLCTGWSRPWRAAPALAAFQAEQLTLATLHPDRRPRKVPSPPTRTRPLSQALLLSRDVPRLAQGQG